MPIPLAMMPAFMAYQSILMGDAFGQGYQYGKRRISAMTNEEFNKTSISQIFQDATIEYDRMIPTLKGQMKKSQELQGFIVNELLSIIPNLIKDAFGATSETEGPAKDSTQRDSPFLKNQSFQQAMGTIADPIFIRYTTDRQPVFNEPAISSAKEAITKALTEQAGTKADLTKKLADERKAERLRQANLLKTPATSGPNVRQQTSNEQAFVTWQNNIFSLQNEYKKLEALRIEGKLNDSGQSKMYARQAEIRKILKQYSNDYRNPNPEIQRAVIFLRQQLSKGIYFT